MQPCSLRLGSLCSFISLLAVLFSAAQLSEARQLHGLQRYTQMPSRLSASGNLRTADSLHHRVPEVIPVCNGAYAVLGDPVLPDDRLFGGKSLHISISGVKDPAGQQPLIAVDSILQNEPPYSQHQQDACPDAEVTGPNSVLLRYEYARLEATSANGLQKGRTYYISFTARNLAGFYCSGMVKACVPFEGQRDCVVTAQDVLHDSRVCSPAGSKQGAAVGSDSFSPWFTTRVQSL